MSIEFKFKEPFGNDVRCDKLDDIIFLIIFRWTSNEMGILNKRFNFSNVIRYSKYYHNYIIKIKLWNLKGFDINIRNEKNEKQIYSSIIKSTLSLSNCRFDFYHNKKRIESCQDIIGLNITRIESIFQSIPKFDIYLRNIEYNQNTICPLLFNNTKITYLTFRDLVDTFYKINIVKFSNETFNRFESNIYSFFLKKVHNINLDLNLLNPLVFKNTKSITISSSSLNSIHEGVFKILNKLSEIQINSFIFRKINHKQGIEWIKQLNHGINVNLSHFIPENISHKEIKLLGSHESQYKIPVNRIFPDEDFCIYVDYPFKQLVILYELCKEKDFTESLSLSELPCTYLWLIRYFKELDKLIPEYNIYKYYFMPVLNTTAFKSISKCKFEQENTFM
jgi:hypothetical protein